MPQCLDFRIQRKLLFYVHFLAVKVLHLRVHKLGEIDDLPTEELPLCLQSLQFFADGSWVLAVAHRTVLIVLCSQRIQLPVVGLDASAQYFRYLLLAVLQAQLAHLRMDATQVLTQALPFGEKLLISWSLGFDVVGGFVIGHAAYEDDALSRTLLFMGGHSGV